MYGYPHMPGGRVEESGGRDAWGRMGTGKSFLRPCKGGLRDTRHPVCEGCHPFGDARSRCSRAYPALRTSSSPGTKNGPLGPVLILSVWPWGAVATHATGACPMWCCVYVADATIPTGPNQSQTCSPLSPLTCVRYPQRPSQKRNTDPQRKAWRCHTQITPRSRRGGSR
jgi:hypothetical protein